MKLPSSLCRWPGFPADLIHVKREMTRSITMEEPLVLSESLYETRSSQAFLADPEIRLTIREVESTGVWQ